MCKNILSFDTSMSSCSVAIYSLETKKVLFEAHEEMNRGQSERLMPMIDKSINDSNLDYKDINLIACTQGPGAFTGLRLSLAAAKALSLSLKIPIIGITTLEAVFETYTENLSLKKNTLVCLETKRKDFYVQVFNSSKKPLTKPEALSAKETESIIENYSPIIIGDANSRLKSEISITVESEDIFYPHCPAIAKLAAEKYISGNYSDVISPLYLRDADVSFPATKK